jgi:Leucine-rich repeat (LRR) protein
MSLYFRNLWYLYLSVNMFTSIPTTIRNIRQLYLLDLSHNPIRQIESHTFNNSKIKYLDLDLIQALTKIDNCAFCGLTVWVFVFS